MENKLSRLKDNALFIYYIMLAFTVGVIITYYIATDVMHDEIAKALLSEIARKSAIRKGMYNDNIATADSTDR
jgi:uncharacterized protein YneF (UPF0154 family)